MSIVSLKDNKIIISKEAAEQIGISADDRIEVRYWSESPTITYPVIAPASVFGDTEGKRVTKKLTVSYRGQQAQVLEVYGTDFELEPLSNGMFKMNRVQLSESTDAISDAESDLESFDEVVGSDNSDELDW